MPHHVGPQGEHQSQSGGRGSGGGGRAVSQSLYCGFCRKEWARQVNKAYDCLVCVILAGSGAVSGCAISGRGNEGRCVTAQSVRAQMKNTVLGHMAYYLWELANPGGGGSGPSRTARPQMSKHQKTETKDMVNSHLSPSPELLL